ncbi:ATP-binding protein [Fimbriimonas ginsengisoli]|uniref:histidine kinase n=1 Tax=Fimbriimonas ginsengisoli Gsoil 348 TaxID=661478 RepID=A0A068NP14_FIMGI|nr:ATP-binding protein [Fimbriimonas ginsengisoli]AIE84490.1 two-component sensor histidine kinase [Fimbriimonas ginsengisoli Gsoil 348]
MRRQEHLFPVLTEEQIQCLEPFGDIVEVPPGGEIFREKERSDSFFVLLEGEIKITRQVNGQELFIVNHGPGEFTGELSVLTHGENLATGTALEPSRLLKIDFFCAMHTVSGACPELMAIVIPALAQRRPEAMTLDNQRAKLASLGVLAAGLAHELNNPASAARRSAAHMRERLGAQREAAIRLCEHGVGPDGLHALQKVLHEMAERPPVELGPLERSDRETEIGDRLTELGVPDPWEVASALVEAGFARADVDALGLALPCDAVKVGLDWLANALIVQSLSREIETSTGRIADLVSSIKGYSAMDQASVQNVDVRPGLEDTLTMLGHKIRRKEIRVVKEFAPDTPVINAIPGELNQVWTNLIDNAVDAMANGGTLKVRTEAEGDCLLVEIEDNGSGIPEEIRDRIFDPFFTTKPVGEGTGLGLDIAYKIVTDHHDGDIRVDSEPGRTVFQIRLPDGS